MRDQDQQQSRVFYELGSMIIQLLTSPPLPLQFPILHSAVEVGTSSSSQPSATMSPATFGSLFIGISVALMLFGSVTFLIGLVLMPLVVGLVLLFYFAALVSSLSELGRSILCPSDSDKSQACAW